MSTLIAKSLICTAEEVRRAAYLSDDRRYRYWLTRAWDDSLPMICVIGVNPSTADANTDDPTIRKCLGFARRLGFGSLLMLNVGAYRATDPREWIKAVDPFGPENTVSLLKQYITEQSLALTVGAVPTPTVVAAWGRNCSQYRGLSRALAIVHSMPFLMCWGKNKDHTPRHPLTIPYSTPLELLCGPSK
jgi:hypothetical protein